MDPVWRIVLISVLIAESFGDNHAVSPTSTTVQVTTTSECVNCPGKTTTHRTTTQSTLHTNHTTTSPTTAHQNHTTQPSTTAHTNHTTQPSTTAHTNHTTQPSTTAHTNHTTQASTTAHTNHTTQPSTTAHTNHTTQPSTTAHTNHTTAHTNHTTQPSTTAPANHTSTPSTNHTTPHFTTPSPPSATEYFLNGTSGVCLRIKAIFMIQINYTDHKFINYTIPSPPTTRTNGSCGADTVNLTLSFPGGSLELIFEQDKKDSTYYLGAVNVATQFRDRSIRNASTTFKEMKTPLGRSYSCNDVKLNVSNAVSVELVSVQAQAFHLNEGKFGREMNCHNSSNKLVPIVVGIVLLVLIVVVVAAYLIARKFRHRNAGYQPL